MSGLINDPIIGQCFKLPIPGFYLKNLISGAHPSFVGFNNEKSINSKRAGNCRPAS